MKCRVILVSSSRSIATYVQRSNDGLPFIESLIINVEIQNEENDIYGKHPEEFEVEIYEPKPGT